MNRLIMSGRNSFKKLILIQICVSEILLVWFCLVNLSRQRKCGKTSKVDECLEKNINHFCVQGNLFFFPLVSAPTVNDSFFADVANPIKSWSGSFFYYFMYFFS